MHEGKLIHYEVKTNRPVCISRTVAFFHIIRNPLSLIVDQNPGSFLLILFNLLRIQWFPFLVCNRIVDECRESVKLLRHSFHWSISDNGSGSEKSNRRFDLSQFSSVECFGVSFAKAKLSMVTFRDLRFCLYLQRPPSRAFILPSGQY